MEAPPPAEHERRRVRRQGTIVLGVFLTFLAGVFLLAAPGPAGPLEHDLPYVAAALLALFLGGILLGFGLGRRAPKPGR